MGPAGRPWWRAMFSHTCAIPAGAATNLCSSVTSRGRSSDSPSSESKSAAVLLTSPCFPSSLSYSVYLVIRIRLFLPQLYLCWNSYPCADKYCSLLYLSLGSIPLCFVVGEILIFVLVLLAFGQSVWFV